VGVEALACNPAISEATRNAVQGQLEKNIGETPISTNKPGVIVHIYNPSHPECTGRTIKVALATSA
jgi:hypothetical protein